MSVELYRRPNVPEFPHLCNTSDHVDNERPEGAEDSDVLPAALPDSQRNKFLALDHLGEELNVHVDMSEVLLEGTSGTSNGDNPGLDGNSDVPGDREVFGT